jgi:DNA-binding CsgD family transcriptional regulator
MDCAIPSRLRFPFDQAISLIRQDRWQLGALRGSKLRVIADSGPDRSRPFRRTRSLSHLARRCLHERQPLTVSAMAGPEPAPRPAGDRAEDWELDWPSLLYAPVGMPRHRPVGLLIVGSRSDHWYPQDEIDYLAALAVTLTAPVLTLGAQLGRLTDRELQVARLVAHGLSVPETAAALKVGAEEARTLVGGVLRKLALRSPTQLSEVWPLIFPATVAGDG